MSYPARSTARDGRQASLWWQSSFGGVMHLCATQGATLVRALQTVLRSLVPLVFTVDGVAFTSADVTVDGNFGPATFAALRRVLEGGNFDVPSTILSTIRQDWARLCPNGQTRSGARGLPIALGTQMAAIYIAAHRDLSWSSLLVPQTMVTLPFADYPPDDGPWAGRIRCAPFSEGAAGLQGGNATNVPVGGSTPRDTPGTPPGPGIVPARTPARSGGGFAVAVLVLIGVALAAGKKRL